MCRPLLCLYSCTLLKVVNYYGLTLSVLSRSVTSLKKSLDEVGGWVE